MKYKNIILIISFIFLSCKNDTNKNSGVVKFSTENNVFIPTLIDKQKELKQSEIIANTVIVKLETTPDCLIGMIHKMLVYKDHIYILDAYKSKGLFEFDMTGNFIRKYGQHGKGPNEYINPISFSIDKKNEELLIYDRATKNLLIYDFEGNQRRTKKLGIYINNFVIDDNGDYILDTHLEKQINKDISTYSLLWVDKENKINKSEHLKYKEEQRKLGFRSRYNLFNSDEITLFNIPYKNTIYEVKKNEIVELLNFEFEGKTIPNKLDYGISYNDLENEITKNDYEHFHNSMGYFLVNNWLLFKIKKGGSTEEYLFNLKTKKLHSLFSMVDVKNFGFFGVKICSYDNYLVNYAYPHWFLNDELFKSKEFDNTVVRDIMKKTKEQDNPILIFNQLKTENNE